MDNGYDEREIKRQLCLSVTVDQTRQTGRLRACGEIVVVRSSYRGCLVMLNQADSLRVELSLMSGDDLSMLCIFSAWSKLSCRRADKPGWLATALELRRPGARSA